MIRTPNEANLNANPSELLTASQSNPQTKRYSLLQAVATSLAAFLMLNLALGFFLYSLLEILNPNADSENAFSLLLLSSGFLTVGLLLIPPLVLAFCRFVGWRTPALISKLRLPSLPILLGAYVLTLISGSWLSSHSMLAFVFLPLFHVAAIGVPIAAILQISLRGIHGTSLQRKWGTFSIGATLAPFLIFIMELFAFIIPLILLAIWISLDAQRLHQLEQLNQILRQPFVDPQLLLDATQPYLVEPAVVLTILFFAALIVPLIEEAMKPLGVWLLYRRTRGALDGFVGGALCGAGYALLESFMLGSSKAEWLLAVVGRSGTGAIHIFTSALVGAALTTAWHRHRYLRLIIAYLISVFFHGIWNGFAILAALRSISASDQGFWSFSLWRNFASAGPFAILFLACLTIVGLWIFNQQIRKEWSTISSSYSEK